MEINPVSRIFCPVILYIPEDALRVLCCFITIFNFEGCNICLSVEKIKITKFLHSFMDTLHGFGKRKIRLKVLKNLELEYQDYQNIFDISYNSPTLIY